MKVKKSYETKLVYLFVTPVLQIKFECHLFNDSVTKVSDGGRPRLETEAQFQKPTDHGWKLRPSVIHRPYYSFLRRVRLA